jgi:flagellar basal body-associated protein FliL
MLEPDRTGVHGNRTGKTRWVLIAVIILLLAAGAAGAVFFTMK